MTAATHVVSLADGRTLTFDVYGDPEGTPVVLSHGFRASRLFRHPDDELTASLGVRIIAPDQPGVGGSTPLPGRTLVDWGSDVEQLVDALGVGSFAVAGHSGGTGHALAIAARLPDRVTHGAVVAPVGPLSDERFDALLVKPDIRAAMDLRFDPPALRAVFDADAADANRDIAAFLDGAAANAPTDAHTLVGDPARRAMFEAAYAAGAVQGGEGRFESWMALWEWGFSLDDVRQPIDVFYGTADDVVPVAMALLIAEALPRGSAHTWPDAGHVALFERECWTAFLSALRDRG